MTLQGMYEGQTVNNAVNKCSWFQRLSFPFEVSWLAMTRPNFLTVQRDWTSFLLQVPFCDTFLRQDINWLLFLTSLLCQKKVSVGTSRFRGLNWVFLLLPEDIYVKYDFHVLECSWEGLLGAMVEKKPIKQMLTKRRCDSNLAKVLFALLFFLSLQAFHESAQGWS